MKKLILLVALIISIYGITANIANAVNVDAVLQYNQGVDFYKIGQYDKALTAFRQAISLDPDYIDAYYNLGSVLEYMQQYDAALVVFKQIIVRRPQDYESIYKAAWLSTQLGNYAKAKEYLKIIPSDAGSITKDAGELASQLDVALAQPKEIAPKASALKQKNEIYENIIGATGITTDSKGNIYVAGFSDNSITKITPSGSRIVFAKDARISGPIGLACDNLDNIYVANYNKNNILKISALGQISILLSNIQKPYYLYLDGNLLFISSQGTNSIIKYIIGRY